MMVGTTRKSSPLDRMWTNLVTCGVPRDDDDVIRSQKEAANGKQPKENMALADNPDDVTQNNVIADDISTSPSTPVTSSPHTQHTPTALSRWKRLRRMLRIPTSRKRKHPTTGNVIKFKNGRTMTVPDIVITAPDDDEEEEEEEGEEGEKVEIEQGENEVEKEVEEKKGEKEEEDLKDKMAAKMADPIQIVDIETTLEE